MWASCFDSLPDNFSRIFLFSMSPESREISTEVPGYKLLMALLCDDPVHPIVLEKSGRLKCLKESVAKPNIKITEQIQGFRAGVLIIVIVLYLKSSSGQFLLSHGKD